MTDEEAHPNCHIHRDVFDVRRPAIRDGVCVDDVPLTKHSDGEYYCLFHLPTNDKDEVQFEAIFWARLKLVEDQIAQFTKLHEHEQELAQSRHSYDFEYVWFPRNFDVGEYKFGAKVDFSAATFSDYADFRSASFLGDADFRGATFAGFADFSSATFSGEAHFSAAKFLDSAYFNSAKFAADAYFNLAGFSSDTDFSSSTFAGEAFFSMATFREYAGFNSARFSNTYFNGAKFSKTEESNFSESRFTADTFFDRARFRNDVSFNSAIFGTDSDVFFRKAFFARDADFQYSTAEGYLRFSNLRQGKHSKFDFQEAAFEKANRVSFHTVDLRPHWFVNVDARKFSFTDIFWINLDWTFGNKNINGEIDAMAETGAVKQKKRIFEVAARQLAVNGEENNRYEEAAKFRYMAMETRRLETTKRFVPSRLLTWLYKWTSGYGERWSLAALVLFAVLAFFALLYNSPFATFIESEKKPVGVFEYDPTIKMNNSEGVVYSLYVAALQRPEPKPADAQTRLFVILETIFAPLQAALLALAIRRKFMR